MRFPVWKHDRFLMPRRGKAAQFVERVTPSRWPSSNRGWRLGVAFAAAVVLLAVAWFVLATLTEVFSV